MDERATLANMATECTARSGIVEADEETCRWIAARRPGVDVDGAARARRRARRRRDLRRRRPRHRPLRARADGRRTRAIPTAASPPTRPTARCVAELGEVRIDIAYGGRCTAGKNDDLDMYHRVARRRSTPGAGSRAGVEFFIQFGSQEVESYAREQGFLETSRAPACASSTRAAAPASAAARASPSTPTRSRSRPSTATTRAAAAPASSTSPPPHRRRLGLHRPHRRLPPGMFARQDTRRAAEWLRRARRAAARV